MGRKKERHEGGNNGGEGQNEKVMKRERDSRLLY